MITLLKQDSFNKTLMLVGLETDTKPTEYFTFKGAVLPIRNGSTFYEADTATFFVYDGDSDTWLEQSGGGYPEPTGTVQITQNGVGIDIKDYAEADVVVPNTYVAADEGKVVDNGELVQQTSKNIGANGTIDTTKNNEVVVSVPNSYAAGDEGKVVSNGSLTPQSQRSITSNGTVDTTLNNECVVAVENSYSAGDEGKVVENGSLVAQSSQSISANGTYDTTKKNEVVVNVQGADADEALKKVCENSLTTLRCSATKVTHDRFRYLSKLEEIDLPNCTCVYQYAFAMGGGNFSDNGHIKSINLPVCREIYNYAFQSCDNQADDYYDLVFPVLTSIGLSAFASCAKLRSISIPLTGYPYYQTTLQSNVFYGSTALETVDLLRANIGASCFYYCSKLTALILRSDYQASTLSNINALQGTPIASGSGYIYAPNDLLNTYKQATNWVTYASQFRALEDYTVDGTTTGALDPSKL